MRSIATIAVAFSFGCSTLTPVERSAKDLRAGLDDLKDARPCQALPALDAAAREDPENHEALRRGVEAAQRCGRLALRTAEARRAVVREPKAATPHYVLGLCLLAGSGEKEGLAQLALAEQLAPTVAEYALRLGVALLSAERFSEAVAPLRAAVALAPAASHPHVLFALALHRTGKNAQAIKSVGAAILLEPSARDLDAIRRLLRRIHDPYHGFPESARARFAEGMGWLERSEAPQRAIDIFEELQQELPQLAVLQSALGLAYDRMGDAPQAVVHLEHASELDPTLPEPHLYLGEIYDGLRRTRDAVKQYRAALAQDPTLVEARDRLAQLDLDEGDLRDVLEQERALVALRQGSVASRLALTGALTAVGDFQGAEKQLRLVLLKDPENLQAVLDQGALFARRASDAATPEERRRWSDRARERLQTVLRRQPDNAAATRLLASLGG